MDDFSRRAAIVVLLLAGLATAVSPFALVQLAPSAPVDAWALPLLWQRHLLIGLLGAGLVLAAFLPGLRPSVLGAAILTKAGFLALALAAPGGLRWPQWVDACLLALLLAAAVVLAREAWREARWDGMLPLRSVEM